MSVVRLLSLQVEAGPSCKRLVLAAAVLEPVANQAPHPLHQDLPPLQLQHLQAGLPVAGPAAEGEGAVERSGTCLWQSQVHTFAPCSSSRLFV